MSLFWFYGLFYGALSLGHLAHRHKQLAPPIMRLTILILETPIFIYSFWLLDLNQVTVYAPIPIIAALLVLLVLLISHGWSKVVHDQRPLSQGSFVLSAGFSNIGTTGGAFICYLLFGLNGLALGYLFLLPYPFLIFTLGFSIAKRFAAGEKLTIHHYLHNIFHNIFSLVPLLAISCGLTLNLLGYQPWQTLIPIMDGLIKLDLVIMCFAIGMTIELHKLLTYRASILALAAIKFLVTPLLALLMVVLVYDSFDLLPVKIILIQAAMPPAIYAVITVNLYRLDRDLINALWLANTVVLIPIVGILYLLFH